MSIDAISDHLKDYAKDLRLNLSTVLTEEGAPGLSLAQIFGTALACSYQTRHSDLIRWMTELTAGKLTPESIEAIKGATAIMAMNNVYYRSLHLMDGSELNKLPARLRMSIIGKHGIDKTDFELFCFSVSSLGGCSSCLKSHGQVLQQAGISNEGLQSALRIAAVINGVAQALVIG